MSSSLLLKVIFLLQVKHPDVGPVLVLSEDICAFGQSDLVSVYSVEYVLYVLVALIISRYCCVRGYLVLCRGYEYDDTDNTG